MENDIIYNMKNIILASLLIGTFISCSLNKEIDPEQYPQKWELIEISGSIADVPPLTGKDMDWQEYYLLNSDNSFVKSRERDKIITEVTGTFAFVIGTDSKYLELSYESDNKLIGNCTSEIKEHLNLNSENLLVGTWVACDGPGLVYERVE